MGDNGAMGAILYPVAQNAEQALHAPLARAARASEAEAACGSAIVFATEMVGPAFATREAAVAAYGSRLEAAAPEERCCTLREVLDARPPGLVRPTYRDGRRWPDPPPAPKTIWRLSISYWRIGSEEPAAPTGPARRARRDPKARDLNGAALRRLTERPLAPLRPQQALDIGLFEMRPPEAPHMIIPDE